LISQGEERRLLAILLVQQGFLVMTLAPDESWQLPATYIGANEVFDLPTLILARNLFGWRPEVGGLLAKDVIGGGVERMFVSAFYDADHPSQGTVPERAIKRIGPSSVSATFSDTGLIRAATLALS
jgi:hypothetical protein